MLGNDSIMPMLATARPEAAKAFYCDVLGLGLVEDTMFALVLAAGPVTLRVQKVGQLTPAPFTALAWIVPDLAARMLGLTLRSVRFERFEGLGQDADEIWTAPNGDKIAWFKDPDGNLLSLTQLI